MRFIYGKSHVKSKENEREKKTHHFNCMMNFKTKDIKCQTLDGHHIVATGVASFQNKKHNAMQ